MKRRGPRTQGLLAAWRGRLGRDRTHEGERRDRDAVNATGERSDREPMLATGIWSFGIEDTSQGCEFDEPEAASLGQTIETPGVRAGPAAP